MYLVLVTMENRSNRKKSSHTYEVKDEEITGDPTWLEKRKNRVIRAKQIAIERAKRDYGQSHTSFAAPSCQRDK